MSIYDIKPADNYAELLVQFNKLKSLLIMQEQEMSDLRKTSFMSSVESQRKLVEQLNQEREQNKMLQSKKHRPNIRNLF